MTADEQEHFWQARQAQEKRLSVTRVLVEAPSTIAGYYTLALGQVNFDELPHDMARKLPRAFLPISALAWLGLAEPYQGKVWASAFSPRRCPTVIEPAS